MTDFSGPENQYHRTTIIIDQFADGTFEVAKKEERDVAPPCMSGECRAMSFDQESCQFDPRKGLCGGRMS